MRPSTQFVRHLSRSAQLALKPSTTQVNSASPSVATACPHLVATADGSQHQPQNANAVQARPYSEVPGPKPLPLLGNTWRYVLKSGSSLWNYIRPNTFRPQPLPIRWPVPNLRSGARFQSVARRVRRHCPLGRSTRSTRFAVRLRCGRNREMLPQRRRHTVSTIDALFGSVQKRCAQGLFRRSARSGRSVRKFNSKRRMHPEI